MKRREFLKNTVALSLSPALLVANNSVAFDLVDYEELAKERYFYTGKHGDYRLTWSLLPKHKIAFCVYGPEWNAWTRWTSIEDYDWEVGWLVNEVKKTPERVINDIRYCVRNHITNYNGFPIPKPICMRHHFHPWADDSKSIWYNPHQKHFFPKKEKNG